MTMIDMHAHFLSDFYRDALLVAGLRQADRLTQLPAWDVGAALQAMDRLSMCLGRPSCIRAVSQGACGAGSYGERSQRLRRHFLEALSRRDCHVLDSQRSLFSAQLTLAQDRGNEFQSLVQLYKALGGGWKA